MFIYKVYEEGKLIFTGTSKEIKKRFELHPDTSFNKYTGERHVKMMGKYDVVVADTVENQEQQIDTTWDCLRMMLVVRKEKKTSVAKDPHKYIGRLRDLGVEVRVTPYMSMMIKDTDITAPPKSKRKPQKCWYVERV